MCGVESGLEALLARSFSRRQSVVYAQVVERRLPQDDWARLRFPNTLRGSAYTKAAVPNGTKTGGALILSDVLFSTIFRPTRSSTARRDSVRRARVCFHHAPP